MVQNHKTDYYINATISIGADPFVPHRRHVIKHLNHITQNDVVKAIRRMNAPRPCSPSEA